MKTGYYGKIPSRGDFISRQLPRGFIDAWDPWLQQGLSATRDSYPDDWLEIYLTCPVWYFALSKNVCDEHAWIGIMIPSVDKVGRYFPFILAKALGDNDSPFLHLVQQQAWYQQAEKLILSTLDEDFNMDTFHDELNQLDHDHHEYELQQSDEQTSLTHWRFACNDVNQGLALMAEHYVRTHFPFYSLWWSKGSEDILSSLLVSRGLPATQAYISLLDGEWREGGWQEQTSISGLSNLATLESNSI